MVRFDLTTVIHRQIEEVFPYFCDLRNAPQWQSWLRSVTQQGPTRVGTKTQQSGQWMGRTLDFESEVTELEEGRKFSFAATSPFPYSLATSFAPVAKGTQLNAQLLGEPGGFFKLAEPLVARLAKQMWRADFGRLKTLLESGAATWAQELRAV
ncbi:MAG: SRPBCC family protein [Candidatus Dormibacteria bacterium]